MALLDTWHAPASQFFPAGISAGAGKEKEAAALWLLLSVSDRIAAGCRMIWLLWCIRQSSPCKDNMIVSHLSGLRRLEIVGMPHHVVDIGRSKTSSKLMSV